MRHMQHLARPLLILFSLLSIGVHWPATAAEVEELSAPGFDTQVLQSKIDEVSATTSIDDATKVKLTELYRKAQTFLEKARSYQTESAAYIEARKTAPAASQKLLEDLPSKEKLPVEKGLKLSEKTPLIELEQQLQKEKADLAAVEARLSDLKKQHEVQTNRPGIARERLITATRQQESIATELASGAPEGELAALTQARKWAHEAQAYALSDEIKMLDQELLSHQARMQLLEAKIEDAEVNVRFNGARVRLLENTLSKRRLEDASQIQKETAAIKEELKDKHPLVLKLAEENVGLGEEIKARALDLERVSARDDKTRADATRVSNELSTLKQKLEIAGLSQALGQVLMEQRRTLPQLSNMQREYKITEKLIANSSLRQIQQGEERRRLRDIDSYVSSLTKNLTEEDATEILTELRTLTQNRRELLDKAISTESSYQRTLGELDLAQRQLIEVVETYDDFLGKRLLWIRSTDPVKLSLFKELPAELSRLLSLSNWTQAGGDLWKQVTDEPLWAFMFLVLIALSFMRRRFLESAVTAGNKVGRVRTDSFTHTMKALGWTILASTAIPLLILAIGWQLSQIPEATEFTKAVSAGLIRMSAEFLLLLFFYDSSIPNGLVVKHFRWATDSVSKLHTELKLLMALFLPSMFITVFNITLDRGNFGGSLAMIAIFVGIGSIGLFIYRTFTPQGGILGHFLARRPQSLLARFRTFWVSFLIAYILVIIGLVFAGYLYTGGMLTRHLISTIWLIYILSLARALVVRWLLLVRRRLAFQAILDRREEARAEREAAEKTGVDERPVEDILEVEEPEVDLAALDADSRKLLNTAVLFAGVIGMWLIWSPALPAFGILEDVSLWSHTEIVDGVETVLPITLADLALAIIVAIITVSAAQGMPAFIEIALLQRISITAGARYTATTLSRYAIVGIGTIVFFSILGASWSQIQWLVAALGVGIGFGLQEIVANFISGLIILFERPIRVGDTVSVGDTSGVVTQIKIRATTITNWDRQELLVPNKEFITNRLLNWSLSDPIIRVRIYVGIAYGSDVAKALELLREAADEHENVLKDPAPMISFDTFGDNNLNLQLRAYLPSMDNRIRTISELNQAINDKFNEAGIVVSFPQRDVHLDVNQPIDIRLHNEKDQPQN